MNQVEFAVHQTAHGSQRGFLAEMAKHLGIGEQVLRNKVNPEQEHARLYLDEAIRMMHKDGDLRILEAVAAEFGRSITGPCTKNGSVLMAMLSANAEHGDVSRAVADALADRVITQAELAALRLEIEQARKALCVLEQTLISEAR